MEALSLHDMKEEKGTKARNILNFDRTKLEVGACAHRHMHGKTMTKPGKLSGSKSLVF